MNSIISIDIGLIMLMNLIVVSADRNINIEIEK